MGYLREEMMKTGKLQAREKQTLAEWKAGAGGWGVRTWQPRGVGEPGQRPWSTRRACRSPGGHRGGGDRGPVQMGPRARSPARIRIQNVCSAQAGCATGAGTTAHGWGHAAVWGPAGHPPDAPTPPGWLLCGSSPDELGWRGCWHPGWWVQPAREGTPGAAGPQAVPHMHPPPHPLQVKVREQRQRILVEFEKMDLLLVEEEQRLLQALKQEEEEVAAKLRESAAALEKQSHALERLLLQLEDKEVRTPLQTLQVGRCPLTWRGRGASAPCSPGWRGRSSGPGVVRVGQLQEQILTGKALTQSAEAT